MNNNIQIFPGIKSIKPGDKQKNNDLLDNASLTLINQPLQQKHHHRYLKPVHEAIKTGSYNSTRSNNKQIMERLIRDWAGEMMGS